MEGVTSLQWAGSARYSLSGRKSEGYNADGAGRAEHGPGNRCCFHLETLACCRRLFGMVWESLRFLPSVRTFWEPWSSVHGSLDPKNWEIWVAGGGGGKGCSSGVPRGGPYWNGIGRSPAMLQSNRGGEIEEKQRPPMASFRKIEALLGPSVLSIGA